MQLSAIRFQGNTSTPNTTIYAHKKTQSRETEVEYKNSRAIEMSAEVTSGGRSSKSMPLPSSVTSTKLKEVWERFAEGVGMGRRRWAVLGRTAAGLAESEAVLPEGKREEGLGGEAGRWVTMGVETWDVSSSSSEMRGGGGWDIINGEGVKVRGENVEKTS